ncbi:ATP-binding protein [Azospirillum humicireducens]|uniref:ATP-binding protein n=1 Tax=Azospirillum humicireducens TaxID=1226968 RepID=UPI001F261DF1|nr:ATP-binding protein [Azospirillum humicireducens]
MLSLTIRNIGCIGNDGLTVALDNIVCLVGQNNAGKSTVLRAYELAVGTISFDAARDRCQRAGKTDPSEIILDVHIPEGIGNIDEKWKDENLSPGLSVVRSRWQWTWPDFKRVRTTWLPTRELADGKIDPESGKWSEDGKAGGADPVFNSRLPRPLRIGSLDDVTSEVELLKLALEPALTDLKAQSNKADSQFATTMAALTKLVTEQAEQHRTRFDEITTKVTDGFQKIFPGLTVRMDVQMASPSVKLDELLTKGSTLKVTDGGLETTLAQQGTGARRALFWAMLQVRSALTREKEVIEKAKKSEGKPSKSSQKQKN